MSTLARPGRPLSSRVQRAYRLELAGRTVFVLLVLLALTGLVIFYLGVVTGKGLRDPNQPAAVEAAAPAPAASAGEAKPAPVPTALNHALQAPTGQIEGLKKDESTATQQTQQLLSRAKQELALDEVQPKSAVPPAPPVAAPPAPAALPAPLPPAALQPAARTAEQPAPKAQAKPAAAPLAQPAAAPLKKQAPAAARAPAPPAAATADSESLFTVQVFSSPQQAHAQEILADLKKRGFPAYMNQFQAADKRTWYRVRVGKGTRAQADALATRLRQATNLQDLRVLKP
jgi:cell division septation protein DedD